MKNNENDEMAEPNYLEDPILNDEAIHRDPAIVEMILKRQQDFHKGLVSSRPWEEVKEELLKRRKSLDV